MEAWVRVVSMRYEKPLPIWVLIADRGNGAMVPMSVVKPFD